MSGDGLGLAASTLKERQRRRWLVVSALARLSGDGGAYEVKASLSVQIADTGAEAERLARVDAEATKPGWKVCSTLAVEPQALTVRRPMVAA